jgi:hypothetical protein
MLKGAASFSEDFLKWFSRTRQLPLTRLRELSRKFQKFLSYALPNA